jgi:hypothetical protein
MKEVNHFIANFSIIHGSIQVVSPKEACVEVRNICVSNMRLLQIANVEFESKLHNL